MATTTTTTSQHNVPSYKDKAGDNKIPGPVPGPGLGPMPVGLGPLPFGPFGLGPLPVVHGWSGRYKELLFKNLTGSIDELPIIVIAGNTGAGKTRLANELSELLGLPLYETPKLSEALSKFYAAFKASPDAHVTEALGLQMTLLNERHEQYLKACVVGKGGIFDHSLFEDLIYATVLKNSGVMTAQELQTQIALTKRMQQFAPQPHLLIYLKSDPNSCLERIRARQRPFERHMGAHYLVNLNQRYQEVFKTGAGLPRHFKGACV